LSAKLAEAHAHIEEVRHWALTRVTLQRNGVPSARAATRTRASARDAAGMTDKRSRGGGAVDGQSNAHHAAAHRNRGVHEPDQGDMRQAWHRQPPRVSELRQHEGGGAQGCVPQSPRRAERVPGPKPGADTRRCIPSRQVGALSELRMAFLSLHYTLAICV